MNDFEKEIQRILKRPIKTSQRYENAIDNAFNNKNFNKTRKIFSLKFATAVCCMVLTFSSVVFATYKIYENVWKEPKIVTQKLEEERVLKPLNNEELECIINEEKAISIAKTVVKNLGYESKGLLEIKTTRSYDNEEDIFYLATLEDIVVQLNAKTGMVTYINDTKTSKMIGENDVITTEEAIEIANKIYKSIGIENIEDYKVITSEEKDFAFGEMVNRCWEIVYALSEKDTDKFTITYKIVDGVVYINTLTYRELNNFDNNPITITKDEAIKIVVDKENEFSSLPISKYDAELDMKKMNIFIYALENNVTNNDGSIQIEDIKRNVWVVYIEHEKEHKPRNGEIQTVREEYNKKYYIDATTGEIIGGEQAEF